VTREKLIEAMRAGAIAAGKGEPSWADCVTDDEWEAALLAIEASGAVVVFPDDATVEHLAITMCAASAYGWSGDWENTPGKDLYRHTARAVLDALKGEGK
jgi:hypothetical protein